LGRPSSAGGFGERASTRCTSVRGKRSAARSTPSTAAGSQPTAGRKGLSRQGAADDSAVIEGIPPSSPLGHPQGPKERPMKKLLQVLASLFTRLRTPTSIEERYLAQAIDANDFEVRLQVIERGRL
jgi:hypothetical protein